MSFSSDIKEELCGNFDELTQDERKNILYGLMLFGREFSKNKMFLQTEKKFIANYYAMLCSSLINIIIEIRQHKSKKNETRSLYTVSVEGEDQRKQVLEFFLHNKSINNNIPLKINFFNLKNNKDRGLFLRGVFLTCGTMINPEKEYHLEFVIQSKELCYSLKQMLDKFDIKNKIISRYNMYVLYVKESEGIEDFLTLIGAIKASFSMMDIKILKGIKNQVNRLTNCETANIYKTVDAASKQIKSINRIVNKKGWDYFPDDLRELAQLRLNNQDLSLRELGELLEQPLTRSGVNHRIKRIMDLENEI